MSTVGRVAAGVAVGAGALGAGAWTAHRAASADTPLLDGAARHVGAPQPLFDGLGIAGMAGAVALATLVGRGDLTGRAALLAVPAALALGAAGGAFLGRRGAAEASDVRSVAADTTPPPPAVEAPAPTPAPAPTSVEIREFQQAWRTDDDVVDITFEEAADVVLEPYDHDSDDAIDIHPGQVIETDERAAEDHVDWRGGASGPAAGQGSKVQTHLPWLLDADADGDQLVTHSEVAAQLQVELDADSNGLLRVGEGLPPVAEKIGDYRDLDAWSSTLSER